MCGRVVLSIDENVLLEILKSKYRIDEPQIQYQPRYNVSPGQNLLSIIQHQQVNHICQLHWGFVPNWAKDINIGYKMINSRSETADKKTSFKTSFIKKRCSILVNGFYEWKKEKDKKQPYLFCTPDHSLFSLAGLWTSWTQPDGDTLFSCTIMTTQANQLMRNIHHRMPVILDDEKEKVWLDSTIQDPKTLHTMLKPTEWEHMIQYPVSTKVNNTRFNQPECLDRID